MKPPLHDYHQGILRLKFSAETARLPLVMVLEWNGGSEKQYCVVIET